MRLATSLDWHFSFCWVDTYKAMPWHVQMWRLPRLHSQSVTTVTHAELIGVVILLRPVTMHVRKEADRAGLVQVGKKRQAKNDKFGFGGRKRLRKQNDPDSAADMDGFQQGRFGDERGRRGGRGGRGGCHLNALICITRHLALACILSRRLRPGSACACHTLGWFFVARRVQVGHDDCKTTHKQRKSVA